MPELISALSDWNPWWEIGSVPAYLRGVRRPLADELLALAAQPELKIVQGVRRSGKSTLFLQVVDDLIARQVPPRNIVLVNFEDPVVQEAQLEAVFGAYLADRNPRGRVYLFLDEVTATKGWERWVRKEYDLKRDLAVFITGSSADLLARDASSLLSGRILTVTVFPLGFEERLQFPAGEVGGDAGSRRSGEALRRRLLEDILQYGGFPAVVLREPAQRRRLLTQYFDDIVLRDVVARHGLNAGRARDLARFLLTHTASLVSQGSLKKALGYGHATIEEYVSCLEEAFLLFRVPKFDYSLARQAANPKKVYAIDTGLRNAVAFKFSTDRGRILENLVFLELRRRGAEIYYWKSPAGREVDFLIKTGPHPDQAIQVCADLADPRTRKRELRGLLDAAEAFNIRSLLVLTPDQQEDIVEEGLEIEVRSLPDWLETLN